MEEPQGKTKSLTLTREIFFPTMIFYRDLPEAEALNASIKPHIYRWRSEDGAGIVRSNMKKLGSWHSALDMAQRPEYREFVDIVVSCAQTIFDDLGYDPNFEPCVDNMWANLSPKFGFNRSHTHPNVLWSGVYYVQSNADSGRIFFTDPRPQAQMLIPRYAPGAARKPEVWSEVFYQPIEGRIVLFPSWLTHEVEPNLSDGEGAAGDRISISFNLNQRRKQST